MNKVKKTIESTTTTSKNGSSNDRSVLRAGHILEVILDSAGSKLGISKISELTNLSPSTVHRIVQSLVSTGLLEQDPSDGRYRLGTFALRVGTHAIKLQGADMMSYPAMYNLAEATGEGVNLGLLIGAKVVYIQKIHGSHPLRTDFPIGSEVPAHCSAIGKVILAFSNSDVVESCLGYDFTPRTSKTISDRNEFDTELEHIRNVGYSIDDEEFMEGITCIGAPVFSNERIVGAVAVQAPTIRMSRKDIEAFVPELITAAKEISRSLA